VVVYPGEIIPVDGEIIDGHAMIDQKTITGEGLPVMRAKGEAVFAATVIRDGQLTVRAIRVGSFTTAGQIARLVESRGACLDDACGACRDHHQERRPHGAPRPSRHRHFR
jgi:P-type E1-E2 ATPase